MEIFYLIRVTRSIYFKLYFDSMKSIFQKTLKVSTTMSIDDFYFFIVSWIYPIVYNRRITFYVTKCRRQG